MVLHFLLVVLLALSVPAIFVLPPLTTATLLHAGPALAGQYYTLLALRDVVLGVLPAPRGAIPGALRCVAAAVAVIAAAPLVARVIGDAALARQAWLLAALVAFDAVRSAVRAAGRDEKDVAPSLPTVAAVWLPSLAIFAGALFWPTLVGLIALQAVAAGLAALAGVAVRAGRPAAPPPDRTSAMSRAAHGAGLLVLAAWHGPLAVAVVHAAIAVNGVASAVAMAALAALRRPRHAPLAFALGFAVAVLLASFVAPALLQPEAGGVRLLLILQPAALALRGALWGKRPLPRWRTGVELAALALAIPAAVAAGAAGFIAAGMLRALAIAPDPDS